MTENHTSAQPAPDAHSGPTAPGEGDGTPGSSTAKSEPIADLPDWERELLEQQAVTDAAVEAASRALLEQCAWYGMDVDLDRIAVVALRAAAPILRQAVAEEIARRIEDEAYDGQAAAIAREIGAKP